MLTIKEFTQTVGHGITPRMVRHYHEVGLLPQPERSEGNYRLYSDTDVQRLRRIVALKQQGFQLSHIKQMLTEQAEFNGTNSLLSQLQQQYQTVLQRLIKLRQTATALESLLGRDRGCQSMQADAIAQLRLLEAATQSAQSLSEDLWHHLDAATSDHPENFREALQQLLPDLSQRPEIEVDVLSHLVLACGDVSLAAFVRFSKGAIKAARDSLQRGCTVVGDVPAVTNTLDQTRLVHLGCQWTTLLENPHISSVADAEQTFWQATDSQERLCQLIDGNIWVVGYAPSILIKLCEAVSKDHRQPALIIGLPLGFSHAPAAKRQLMQLNIPYLTVEGTLGGGLLAAVAFNRLAASLIEKPDCHCYLG
ncbi:precorrin-8X methylmutase [Oscillatoria sp. CS-180]|uniref:precorrin-8X methylmutase n=1 Tax=Oscillatoria sp. CS-180 TaxID=3021720 RepID=UPI00232D93D6|nr:precorrin-8X methylmutase [Oscillatoria sp. CS-180]MDB9526747.1 precorrin-8X methylmutase [Oscillatoria sp. CS-180]